ncbi:cysteine desulfurase, partial [Dimargaris cristalligena]
MFRSTSIRPLTGRLPWVRATTPNVAARLGRAWYNTTPKTLAEAETTPTATVVTPDQDSLGFQSQLVKDPTNAARPIYLDVQATTPTDPRVLDAMLPYMTEMYGNPHSRTHKYGWETEKGVEWARRQLALLV